MESARRGFADQLNIETPEQVDLRFPVAGIGSRFVAVLVDHLIQLVPYVLIFIAALFFPGSSGGGAPAPVKPSAGMELGEKWAIAIITLINFVWITGYFALFEAFWHGQTPGKRLMKLRVIKDSGRQITLFEALARNLLRIIDILPTAYAIGVITMLCNRKNKRLGDFAAGTLVVHELPVDDRPAEAFLSGTNYFAPKTEAPPENPIPADAISRLDAADLHVIETFFARALDLDMPTRARMAERIVARMTAKMRVPPPEGNPERALEAMAKALRGSARRF